MVCPELTRRPRNGNGSSIRCANQLGMACSLEVRGFPGLSRPLKRTGVGRSQRLDRNLRFLPTHPPPSVVEDTAVASARVHIDWGERMGKGLTARVIPEKLPLLRIGGERIFTSCSRILGPFQLACRQILLSLNKLGDPNTLDRCQRRRAT